MRNYLEHPGEKTTEIRNFYWEPDTKRIHLPTWYIAGDKPGAVAKEVVAITEQLTDLVEGILVLAAELQTDLFEHIIVQNDPPKPEMPIRYSIRIDPTMLLNRDT